MQSAASPDGPAEPMAAESRLLIVCLGNICRSPMAEGALRARLLRAGLANRVRVDSVGTGDWHVGQPPDPRAIACAAGHGVDIAGLRARQLHAADFADFDWLLCADRSVLRAVRAVAPARAPARAGLLLDYACGGDAEVPDPYTGGPADFERVWSLVDHAAAAIVSALGGQPARNPPGDA